jgi:uncharacterized protein YraI
MQLRRLTLLAFVFGFFLFLLLSANTALAAPAQQTEPPSQGTATAAANLRAGPGTGFAKVGSVTKGEIVEIAGCNTKCDWYQLDSGSWIAAFLVKPLDANEADAASASSTTDAVTTTVVANIPVTTTASTTTPAAPRVEGASAKSNGNLRSGPGTSYSRVGGVTAGQALEISGRTASGDWYQLADGNWIAAILVVNAPADAPVAEAPAAAAPAAEAPAAAASNSGGDSMQEAMQLWQDRIDLNTTKTCGHFEYKLTDVRKRKSLWLFNREYVAQGEWLLVFLELKNISPGTSYLGNFGPRLVMLTPDGTLTTTTGDFKASSYAGWMFSHGGFYEDINPGNVLGVVEAYDVPIEPDKILGFGLLDCSDDLLSLGVWSKVQPATK